MTTIRWGSFAAVGLMLVSVGFARADLNDGLVGHWPFDGNANDASGNGNDGMVDGATPTADRFGNPSSAYSFDGMGDHIEIADSVELNFGQAQDFCFSLWVKVNSSIEIVSGETLLLRKMSGSSGYGLFVRGTAPTFNFPGRPAVNVRSDSVHDKLLWAEPVDFDIRDDQWHLLTFVRNGDTGILYIDGLLNASSSGFEAQNPSSNTPLYIGEPNFLSGGGEYKGMIDDVRIYNRALSPEEIQQLAAPQLACEGFEPPMDVHPVTAKRNRALPLKTQLFDADDYPVTDMDIVADPVLQVMFQSVTGGTPEDVTDLALPAGLGTDGNQFVFTDDHKWQYNLKTKDYIAPGTYTISIVSGDDTEYGIDPACVTSFITRK